MFNKKISTALLISEMDQNVKRMVNLIGEDADSFAKKAEMYYQKRPELLSLVDDFYRMYRSLSDRFDHATGELRKNIPSEIQSQTSCISEVCSELPFACPSPDPRKSGPRAAGFDVFLGTGVNGTELGYREGDESLNLDYESESDASSVVHDDETLLDRKNILDVELHSAKEKLRFHQEDNSDCSSTESRNENVEGVRLNPTSIAAFEEELRDVKEKLQVSEEEVKNLRTQLSTYESLYAPGHSQELDASELELFKKMVAEKAKLGAKVEELTAEMTSKDDKMDSMCQHLHQLQMEHVKLMSETKGEREVAEELRSRVEELEAKIEQQQEIILEGAEEKRQAIRQLCFSLEHYRSGYLRLRDVLNQLRTPVIVT
ncbi:hypothetical protein Leryth_017427 [Lithospermum erythrorhizon]|nr:hypothetical protein Leryth_017427 [Lithospermum erythrorhizon]